MKTVVMCLSRLAQSCGALITMSLILSACGGGGDSSTPAPTETQSATDVAKPVQVFKASDYVASQPGDQLVYSHVYDSDVELDRITYTTQNANTNDSGTAIAIQESDETNYGVYQYHYSILIDQDGFVVHYKSLDVTPTANAVETLYDTWKKLPATFKVGDKFVAWGIKKSNENLKTESTIESIESVNTPVGKFENCVKVVVNISAADAESDPTHKQDYKYIIWYAPGFGPVAEERYADGVTLNSKVKLIAYRVNGQQNETDSPIATLTKAPSESNHWRFDSITLQFSEPMLRWTLNGAVATVTDPNGKAITGQVKFTENSWTFRPDYGALTVSGEYRVQLTNLATDLAGNTVTPATWTFSVDATPPKFVKAEFSNGQIILTFDEELLPMPEVGSIVLFSDTAPPAIFSQDQITVETNRVILYQKNGFPDLMYGATYRVQVDNGGMGLGDLANNFTLRNDVATITMPQGRF